jgi:AcrR family transcriptional regulator
MPSTTFFNLPAAKREKLLRAARAEFGRTAYAEVSVSRIIQAAGIPRGSFYMYFTDKQELFAYLLEDFGRQMEERMSRLLEGRQGDLFAAFLDLFDEMAREREQGEVQELMDIFRCNRQLSPGVFVHPEGKDSRMERLAERIDRSLLDLRQAEDLENLFHLLITVTAGALMAAGCSGDPAAARRRLVQMFHILERGAARRAAVPVSG